MQPGGVRVVAISEPRDAALLTKVGRDGEAGEGASRHLLAADFAQAWRCQMEAGISRWRWESVYSESS